LHTARSSSNPVADPLEQWSGPSDNTSVLTIFKRGLDLLRNGRPGDALDYLRAAAEREQQNPYYISFYGLCVARTQKKWEAAIDLCETALRWKPGDSQLYLNLAEVYVAAGRRDEAVDTLDKAIRYCKPDARIKRARSRLGRRNSPLVPFLARNHVVNRSLGKLRHRARQLFHRAGDA
jgi:tetratricopeptide (TPR) repeat protein